MSVMHVMLRLSTSSQQITNEVLSGLIYLHHQHIVHRDIKPSNILLSAAMNGRPPQICITDFGLAKRLENGVQIHSRLGTPRYFAPETFHRYAAHAICCSLSTGGKENG